MSAPRSPAAPDPENACACWPPHGMAQVGLGVGTKVNAVGELRMTVPVTRMLEPREVNRIQLG